MAKHLKRSFTKLQKMSPVAAPRPQIHPLISIYQLTLRLESCDLFRFWKKACNGSTIGSKTGKFWKLRSSGKCRARAYFFLTSLDAKNISLIPIPFPFQSVDVSKCFRSYLVALTIEPTLFFWTRGAFISAVRSHNHLPSGLVTWDQQRRDSLNGPMCVCLRWSNLSPYVSLLSLLSFLS